MWWIVFLIIFGFFLVLLGIYGLLMHHNKYFFWKFAKIVPDRNGARKPGEKPSQIYGNLPPTPLKIKIQTNKENLSQPNDTNDSLNFWVDEGAQEFRIIFPKGELARGGLRIRSGNLLFTSRAFDITEKNTLTTKLLKIRKYEKEEGQDALGSFTLHLISWFSVESGIVALTAIRFYPKIPCLIFRIEFPAGLSQTAQVDYTTPIIEFPILENHSNYSLIFTYTQSNFAEPTSIFPERGTSAPLLFYNEDLETMLISPTVNFLTAWNCPSSDHHYEIRMGLEGHIRDLPENFFHECIVYFDRGISQTWEHWGDLILKYYQRTRTPLNVDMITSFLGYWTDNGCQYYYNHKPFANYEEALLNVKAQALQKGVPFRYWQLDSWFYPKDDGTRIWEPDQKLLPNGLLKLSEKLGGPFICHNRWFSHHTFYKSRFGDFVNEDHPNSILTSKYPLNIPNIPQKNIHRWSLPTGREFWNEIMANALSWNCICYEQDWLQSQWRFFDYLRENVYTGRHWLKNMADAVQKYGMTMQYCMPFPSFYMAAVEFPIVTHARCSDDYNHKKSKRIFIPHFTQTSMLCWAMGLLPWKDPFKSTCYPKSGSINIFRRIPDHYEQWSELELLIQVLSAGPVGTGDAFDKLNSSLILQSCREDGLLIKPDRPAFPIDLMFLSHRKPYVVITKTRFGKYSWFYLLQLLIWKKNVSEYFVTLNELGIEGNYIGYDYFNKNLFSIESSTPIGKNHPMTQNEHHYCVLAPILANGMAFIGLRDKIATASSTVFTKIELRNNVLHVEGIYTPRKEFAVIAYVPQKPNRVVVNGLETTTYLWGKHFKMFTIVIRTDEDKFTLEIE